MWHDALSTIYTNMYGHCKCSAASRFHHRDREKERSSRGDKEKSVGSRKMNKFLFQQVKHARSVLTLTIICGILIAAVMIAQMVFLSRIVNKVFLFHQSL